MSSFLKLLKALVPFMQSQLERDETYLAEALDLVDLERRVRVLEAKGRHATSDVRSDLACGRRGAMTRRNRARAAPGKTSF